MSEEKEAVIGIIGGTGLGDTLSKRITEGKLVDVDTPFGKPADKILMGRYGGRQIAFLNRHGPGHIYPPSRVPFQANIFALKKLGVRTLISMGAVGSLSEHIHPGDLVIVDQFIDKTYQRGPNTFFADYGAVHVEMAEPACSCVRDKIIATGKGVKNHQHMIHPNGCYVCMEGPSFSTKAESLMHKAWGGDLIGMTAMPEARLAREAQMCYSLIALVSDYDCWKPHEGDKKVLLEEIIANMNTAVHNCVDLIEAVLSSDHDLVNVSSDECGCRPSLELAVWTNKDVIDEKEKEKLAVLFE